MTKAKLSIFLIRLFVVLVFLLGMTEVQGQTLVIHHADGRTTDVQLFTKPRVLFQNDQVIISSAVLNMEYAKSDVLRFTYKGVSDDIKLPEQDADYSCENGELVFRNIGRNGEVAVYNASGIRVPVRLVRKDNAVSLPLSGIPSGMYVLSINGRTSKFTKP